MKRRIAMVTGASRGIGKASALALASAGFAVAITARTRLEGQGRVSGSSSVRPKEVPVAGSLETTAAEIQALGGEVLEIPMDLLDLAQVEQAAERVAEIWGPVDILVNNAIYQGAGRMDRLEDIPVREFRKLLEGNCVAPLELMRKLLPGMLRAGGGTVINMTSRSGHADPPGPVGQGGWGYAYAASKSALHRMVPILHHEHAADGIRAFNIDPGYTPTDTMRALRGAKTDLDAVWDGAPPEVTAAVIVWLATAPEAAARSGSTIHSHRVCAELELWPGWDGKKYHRPAPASGE
ncbi:MAG: SDR family NAD(P)-dependent oxidoreductase [Candidatus Binatia bacterium]|nr:SDR family NAD(P)-dependent oxidoreductase [Candidatus Binatia bacterium]MDG1958990.1 SDR family NAD(P)-dependent oxidoreductase [Candidatus Binatia bacterium]MDG2008632.1 SDR family NAD(P)-dependent oxidoreductase [Candidatus Binatia bacterium]